MWGMEVQVLLSDILHNYWTCEVTQSLGVKDLQNSICIKQNVFVSLP